MKLAVFASHPIQYKSPLYRRLSAEAGTELQVYYYSHAGLDQRADPYHGMIRAWDTPLLEGYPSQFLPNWIPERSWLAGVLGRVIGPYYNPAARRAVLEGDFDALILHSYQYPSDWLAWRAARDRRIPILYYGEVYPRGQTSNSRQAARRLLHHRMVRTADACLAIGSVAVQVYEQEFEVPGERIFLAPYAVDNDFFITQTQHWKKAKDRLKSELGIAFDEAVVLCVAGMVPKKRQEDLVVAVRRLEQKVRLVLVGDGPRLAQVRAFCQAELPQTILAGFVNQSVLPRFYALADVFVLPSLWEEFGLVVNEAMCAGLPVIATHKVAASRDLICSGQNGFTFQPGDVGELADKLDYLLADRERLHSYGQRSLDLISHWSYTQTVDGIRAALQYIESRRISKLN